ncbi:hypothetical protein ElyMa_005962500 [Elysia marginata]|uniref:Uncharacterized protein n=1 Tax=Elysia marginata TaxID=1093978 RepID=A0AAV4GBL7_9GAST|nr:hypothetical protein ElyMa_005962500 [Elysia marginata]
MGTDKREQKREQRDRKTKNREKGDVDRNDDADDDDDEAAAAAAADDDDDNDSNNAYDYISSIGETEAANGKEAQWKSDSLSMCN